MLLILLLQPVQGSVSCETNEECQAVYQMKTTVCLPASKTCSNPFQQGCFRTLQENPQPQQQQPQTRRSLQGSEGDESNSPASSAGSLLPAKKRVCNSDDKRALWGQKDGEQDAAAVDDDEGDSDTNTCVRSPFDDVYPEVRIHQSNWESSIILSWIYQIVLSEFMDVPTTVGLTSSDTPLASFYSENIDWLFSPVAYPFEALQRANIVAGETTTVNQRKRDDCSSIAAPCVDVLPEVWQGQATEYVPLIANNTIQPPTGNGLLGRSGLYIPSRTAREFPQFTIWFGLAGEANRQLLAETFLRPMTWAEYCEQVSESACSEPSSTAARFPVPEERDLYFESGGLYNGYFAATDANNCTLNPTTCTGHIVTPECTWSVSLDAQLYWNDIVGLARDGPVPPVGGYSSAHIEQIYRAANATGNHIILQWYEPEPMHFEFLGDEEYEMLPVTLPLATLECLAARPDAAARCSDSFEVRRGNSSVAGCGTRVQSLQRITAIALEEHTTSLPEVDQSPAYEFLKHIQVTNLDLLSIIRRWKLKNKHQERLGKVYDPIGSIRESVCIWVSENQKQLQSFIPTGYPRILVERSDYSAWYMIMARAIGGVVACIAFLGFFAVFRFRHTKSMVFAQPIFLQLILLGFCMVSIGAVFYTTTPQKSHCLASIWLIVLGYTIELVPVLVKTAKINQLIRSYTKTQRRIQLNRHTMLCQVAGVVACVVAYLIAWTLIDPPTIEENRTLKTTTSVDDGGRSESITLVESDVRCSAETSVWRYVAFAWQAILLILAAFLAFQSRDIMAQLNESKSLAVMVYSHSLFIILRGVCTVFYIQDIFPSSTSAAIMSLVFSLDTLTAMGIYVIPKLLVSRKAEPYKPGMLSSTIGPTKSSLINEDEAVQEEDDNPEHATTLGGIRHHVPRPLSILVCSANMGNKGPTPESLEAWIPPGGCSDRIKALPDDDETGDEPKYMLDKMQTFDLIAIGMQEATWTSSVKESTGSANNAKKEITEEEVLNALEEANTAQLREMVQEVLGDSYYQIADERRGQMRLHLWAKRKIAQAITEVKISGANTGIGNVLANKGGIVGTVYFQKTRISFVTAHLAAHEGESHYKARCDNIRSILREAKTFDISASAKFDVPTSSHYTFFLGDLNFRTRFENEHSHEEKVELTRNLIESASYPSLYELDELQQGLKKEDFLAGFETLPCPFPPTFKVERDSGYTYKEQRIPSYTDRILFHTSPGLREHLKALSYEACSDFITSDHKPIRGAFSLTPNAVLDSIHIDGDIHFDFTKIRCSNLPVTNTASGKSDPYVMILWDAAPFQSEQVAAWDFLRSLFSGTSRWPRTSFMSKTVNPHWKGEEIALSLKKTKLQPDGMLFLAVINYDKVRRRHEILGSTVFNVAELISTMMNCVATIDAAGEMEDRSLPFERRLLRDGLDAGCIKFTLRVKRHRPAPDAPSGNRKRRSSALGMIRGGLTRNWISTRFVGNSSQNDVVGSSRELPAHH